VLTQSSKPPRPAPPKLGDFPVRVTEIIRFGDLDRQGHVNNAVFATYLESGRVGVIYDAEQGLQVEGATTVMARIEINFMRELHWPGTLEIGTAVGEIGRSSYVFTQAAFHDSACAATGRATMVVIDKETRRAMPLPPVLIERLKRLMPRLPGP
jgi:acyl-CoA thioester hydrolase